MAVRPQRRGDGALCLCWIARLCNAQNSALNSEDRPAWTPPTDQDLHHMPQFSRTVKLLRAGVSRTRIRGERRSRQRRRCDLRASRGETSLRTRVTAAILAIIGFMAFELV